MPDHAAVAEAVFDAVAATAPEIRAGLPGRRVASGAQNPSGEERLAADAHADELLEARIGAVDGVASYASEERPAVVDVGEGSGPGLAAAVDPLDGSSNLKSNNTMGTIVGLYDAALPASGRDLVAAGYVLYGPITTMVTTVGDDVATATVTEAVVDDGQRRPVTEELTLPDEPVVYGFGGGDPDWPADFAGFADAIRDELKLRYGGSMIGDVNQVLTYGGIFAYPALESAPEGKLRLQFEGNPVGYVIEAAGGRSSDGGQSLLDVEATELHQRVPVHLGNEGLVERLEAAIGD